MKIAELKTFVVGNPPPAFGGRYFLFLKLRTACGIEGVGEVYAASFAPKAIVAMIEDVFERHVEGADPFRIEIVVAQRLRSRLFRPAGHFADGRAVRNRDGALGHCRQVGRQACLRASGRQGPRAAAQLHLSLSRRARLARLFRQPGLFKSACGGGARAQIHGARLHRGEVRSGRPLFDLRSAPAEPRAARTLRGFLQDAARGRRDEMRPPVRHPRPVHRLWRAPHGAADRALRAAVVRGADAARGAGGDGPRRGAVPRCRSRPASG